MVLFEITITLVVVEKTLLLADSKLPAAAIALPVLNDEAPVIARVAAPVANASVKACKVDRLTLELLELILVDGTAAGVEIGTTSELNWKLVGPPDTRDPLACAIIVPVAPVVKTFDVIGVEKAFVTAEVVLPFVIEPLAVEVKVEPVEVGNAFWVELPDVPVADEVPVPEVVATFA